MLKRCPKYLKYHIMAYLSLHDLYHFCLVDKAANLVGQDDEFWKYKILTEFGTELCEKDDDQSFKSLYTRIARSGSAYHLVVAGRDVTKKLLSNVTAIHYRFYITPAGHLYYHVGNQCASRSSLDSNLLATKALLYPNKRRNYLRRGVRAIAISQKEYKVTNVMMLDFKGDVYTIGSILNGSTTSDKPRKLVSDVRCIGSSVSGPGFYYVTKNGNLYATNARRIGLTGAKFHLIGSNIKSVSCSAVENCHGVSFHICYTTLDGSLYKVIGTNESNLLESWQRIYMPPVKFFYLTDDILIIVDVNGKCYWLVLDVTQQVPNKLDYEYGQIVKMVPEQADVYFFTQDGLSHSLTFPSAYGRGFLECTPYCCLVTDENTISRVSRTLSCDFVCTDEYMVIRKN